MYGVFYVMRMFFRVTILDFFRDFMGFSGDANENETSREVRERDRSCRIFFRFTILDFF